MLFCSGAGLCNPLVKRLLVRLDPALGVAGDVGGGVFALGHAVVLGVDVVDRQLHHLGHPSGMDDP